MADGQNFASGEVRQMDILHHLLANLKVGLDFDSLRQGDLVAFVLHGTVFHNLAGVLDLQISAVHVDDNVKLGIRAVFLQ